MYMCVCGCVGVGVGVGVSGCLWVYFKGRFLGNVLNLRTFLPHGSASR